VFRDSLVCSFVVLDESTADDPITGKQHCIVQNCEFASVLSYDGAAHDWRRCAAVYYFKRVCFPSDTLVFFLLRLIHIQADMAYKFFYESIEAQSCALSRIPLVCICSSSEFFTFFLYRF